MKPQIQIDYHTMCSEKHLCRVDAFRSVHVVAALLIERLMHFSILLMMTFHFFIFFFKIEVSISSINTNEIQHYDGFHSAVLVRKISLQCFLYISSTNLCIFRMQALCSFFYTKV